MKDQREKIIFLLNYLIISKSDFSKIQITPTYTLKLYGNKSECKRRRALPTLL
jgi:hypothetical protein